MYLQYKGCIERGSQPPELVALFCRNGGFQIPDWWLKWSRNTHGGILSGGQRQRISIARAFLKDAPILILDEMTSNVDPVNESLIQDAITELAKNRTVLVVAHHLKTIQKADQILVFQKGNLLEKGKHGELLEKDGYYTKLWKAQYEV